MTTSPPFVPDRREVLSRARADLRMGLPIVLRDGAVHILAAAAEALSQDRLDAMTSAGAATLVLTARRAETLKIHVYDDDLVRLPLGPRVTGREVLAIADPASDLATPLKGPFLPERDGNSRPARTALALVKAARTLPAAIVCPVEAPPPELTVLDMADLALVRTADYRCVIGARLPIVAAVSTRLYVFRPDDGGEEHYVIQIGEILRDRPVLTRLHSACFTGDVLGSLKCDCGAQLDAALARMAAEGSGLLLYLNQEGRGIGLANKMRAYALQDQGFDTVEANHRLGFDDDERDFGIGARLLRAMNVSRIRLLTNNPRKVAMLEAGGIEVSGREPLWVGENVLNSGYLTVKTEKSGHLR